MWIGVIQMKQDSHKYDDIIDMEHPTSKVHPRMDEISRAAQFAPFAAVSGGAIEREKEALSQLDEDMGTDNGLS